MQAKEEQLEYDYKLTSTILYYHPLNKRKLFIRHFKHFANFNFVQHKAKS